MQFQGTASRKGCVPGLPFTRIMQEWVAKEEIDLARRLNIGVDDLRKAQEYARWSPMVLLAERMGMDIENVRKIKNGKREWIGFDIADRIVVVCTDGLGWRNDPELYAIYRAFDFSWLDLAKPCAVAA